MTPFRAAAVALFACLGNAACDTDLDRDLEGLACRARAPRCLAGYVCSPSNRCVRDGSMPSDGGASGAGGTTAEDSGVPGTGPDATGGSAGTGPDASGGHRYDAGPGLDALDASVFPDAAGCDVAVLLFRDEDEDGFGVTAQAVIGCPGPRWALEGGDCRDDLSEVHPGQMQFFGAGYADPTRPLAGNVSFDYDCDFAEEPAPDTAAAPDCNALLTCEGSGYLPVAPARSGPGVDAICGSTEVITCQSRAVPLLGLTCAAEPLASAPARCR